MSYSTSWIFNITFPSRNQGHMTVPDRLTSSLTAVHSDVERINGGVFRIQRCFLRQQKLVQPDHLSSLKPKIVKHMPFWNDECVEFCHWKPITNDFAAFTFSTAGVFAVFFGVIFRVDFAAVLAGKACSCFLT